MELPFGKDKGRQDQEKIDAVIMSEYEDQDTVLKPSDGGKGEAGSGDTSPDKIPSEVLRKLVMDVERLRAQTEALIQLRSINEERFQRTSEEIGDLRRRLLDKEREITQLRVESVKTTELVSAVQPQNLMKELKKEDTKIEAVKAKQDAIRTIVDSVVEETKNIRNVISTFKGTEMLIKLNEDVKKELTAVKQVELVVEKHANKVESIFGSVQGRFNEFIKLLDTVAVIDSSFKKIRNEFNEIRVKLEDYVKKDDFVNLRKEIDEKTKDAVSKLEGLENLEKELKEEATQVRNIGSKRLYEFEVRTDNRLSEIEAYTKDLSERLETLIIIEQENLRAVDGHYKRLEEVFKRGSQQTSLDETSRTLFRKVCDQLRDSRKELTRNIGLIDDLSK